MKPSNYIGLLVFGPVLIVLGTLSLRQSYVDEGFRDGAVEFVATFTNFECSRTQYYNAEVDDDTVCSVDVAYQPPGGQPLHQRIPIDYDYAYCASTPAFHMDGVEGRIYVHPETPDDFLLPRNPCAMSRWWTAGWFWASGLLLSGFGVWMWEPWRRR